MIVTGNVGRLHKGFRLEVVGPDDKPLSAGDSGNICIKSRVAINGCPHDEAATAKLFPERLVLCGRSGQHDQGRLADPSGQGR